KELVVGPKEVSNDDPLCVNGTLNAIAFTSVHSGTQTIIGKGAGGMETGFLRTSFAPISSSPDSSSDLEVRSLVLFWTHLFVSNVNKYAIYNKNTPYKITID
ncbi:MAG: hypothetical protein O6761_01690, partial [Thaumarchaeota archaeon]|nr:hypothetical protein [Nitrososphaerota archaeon]